MPIQENYNYLENTLQKINAQYIALEEAEVKKNSSILINVSFFVTI